MKRYVVFLLALLLGLAQFAFVSIAHADNPVYISQVQITAGSGHTDEDFVELFNPGSEPANLKGFRLVKRTAQGTTDTLMRSWTSDAFIAPHSFYLWGNNSLLLASAVATIALNSNSSVTLANDNGVAIRSGGNDTGLIIDSVAWGNTNNGFRNVSATNMGVNEGLWRVNLYGADSAFEIRPAAARDTSVIAPPPPVPVPPDPTPPPVVATPPPADPPPVVTPPVVDNPPAVTTPPACTTGTVVPPSNPTNPPDNPVQTAATSNQPTYDISPNIKISEILANPNGDDTGNEFVELSNTGTTDVRLEGWLLDDSTTTGQPKTSALELSGTLQAGHYFGAKIPSGKFILNNTGDTVNLYFPDKTLADQVTYDGAGKEGESYQNVGGTWQWGQPSLGGVNVAPPQIADSDPSPPADIANDPAASSGGSYTSGTVEGALDNPQPTQKPTQIAAVKPVAKSAPPKTTAPASAAKSSPKSSTASATALEKSMDKKLIALQDTVDAFEQESAQNFSSLSSAVQSSQQSSAASDNIPPSASSSVSIRNWIIFAAIVSVLAVGAALKFYFNRRNAADPDAQSVSAE
jgi:hypothetical protein